MKFLYLILLLFFVLFDIQKAFAFHIKLENYNSKDLNVACYTDSERGVTAGKSSGSTAIKCTSKGKGVIVFKNWPHYLESNHDLFFNGFPHNKTTQLHVAFYSLKNNKLLCTMNITYEAHSSIIDNNYITVANCTNNESHHEVVDSYSTTAIRLNDLED